MGNKIIFIAIVIVALGIGLYIYSSGAITAGVNGLNAIIHAPTSTMFGAASTSTGSGATSTATPSSSNSSWWSSLFSFLGPGGGAFTGSGASPLLPGRTTITAPSSGSGFTAATTTVNPADIPKGFTADQLSPYFHKVRLAGVSAGSYYSYGTITLSYNNYNSTGTIDITGWQIRSKNSGEYIPQAINIYDPSGLTPASDILMKAGDVVYLYSSSAPFNVRINECIGYIAHIANFKPALPHNCPYVDRSTITNFTGQCQNYILSIGSCQQPNMSSPQIPRTDYACRDYLENNFTYKSCFQAHAGDAKFLSNQVWVWTGSNVVDPYHDIVELLDRNGLLVDIYSY